MTGSPVTRPAPDLPDERRYALVVATTRYSDVSLRQLRAPAHDADELSAVLADPAIGGFAVTRVIDRSAQEIRLAAEEFLTGRDPEDLLVVYLSCHGLVDVRRRLYFAGTDTLKSRLAATGVESQWLLDLLEDCRAKRLVVILDCCFSGAFAQGIKGEADLDLGERFHGQGRGRVVLTASRGSEYSFEGEPLAGTALSGSVFTSALVDGIRSGAADDDNDGYISVDDAYTYAFDQVRARGGRQTPQRWLYGAEGKILLARSPAGVAVTPAPLPEALRSGLDSPHPAIRLGAVAALGEWLTGDDPARALTARHTLSDIGGTDIPQVASAARALLAESGPGPDEPPEPPPEPPGTTPEPSAEVAPEEPRPTPAEAAPLQETAPSARPEEPEPTAPTPSPVTAHAAPLRPEPPASAEAGPSDRTRSHRLLPRGRRTRRLPAGAVKGDAPLVEEPEADATPPATALSATPAGPPEPPSPSDAPPTTPRGEGAPPPPSPPPDGTRRWTRWLPRRRRTRALLAAVLALVVAAAVLVVVTGGSGDKPTPDIVLEPVQASSQPSALGTVTTDPALAARVPADVKSAGKLTVASDASYAPGEFMDDQGKVVGMDVDLANAVAQRLGLTADVHNVDFASIIPGIASGTYQLGISSFTDTKEREQTVDMVTYFTAGTAVGVKSGNPDGIDPSDLCGKKVAVQTGTTQADEITDVRNPECVKAGKPQIPNDGDKFSLQTDVTQAVVSGHDQAMLADSPAVGYAAKQTNGQVAQVGSTYDTAPYGIAVAKGSPLGQAVQGAVQSLIDDGTYQQILTKWGVEAGAISKSQINGATS
ncbi:transporter substrate-binding domain-containing protein [Kitasatospora sp. NPDC051914]|uniref:caspase, EACC1-associated type n=1 Tax=Kitasatospora sp. NPDC051914 TaxID=3154945 RepID=UPI00341E8D95